MIACPKCGSAAKEGHVFCPDDGHRYGEAVPAMEPHGQDQPGTTELNVGKPGSYKTCPSCGKKCGADFSYCSNDGTALVIVDPIGLADHGTLRFENGALIVHDLVSDDRQEHFETGTTSTKTGPLESEITVPQKDPSPFLDLLTQIDKSNRTHWLRAFDGYVEGKYNFGWNWPSFFFGPIRYCLKGMWAKGITYRLAALVIQAFLVSAFGGNILFLTWLGTAGFFGLMGANDYFLFCLKYREDIVGARNQTILGTTLVIVSPLLIPIMMKVLKILF